MTRTREYFISTWYFMTIESLLLDHLFIYLCFKKLRETCKIFLLFLQIKLKLHWFQKKILTVTINQKIQGNQSLAATWNQFNFRYIELIQFKYFDQVNFVIKNPYNLTRVNLRKWMISHESAWWIKIFSHAYSCF